MNKSQVDRGLNIVYTLPEHEVKPLTESQIKYLKERLEETIHNDLLKLMTSTPSASMQELQTCVRGSYDSCLAINLEACP